MKTERIIYIAIIIILVFLKCGESTPKTIIIPEKKGEFEGVKPIHEKVIEYKEGKETIIENPLNKVLLNENEQLKTDFEKANDSIKKLLYDNAIAINKFSTTFEDENLLLNINGIVRGEVQEVTPSYTIKQQTVSVPNKETVFRLLGGVEVGNTIQLDKLTFKANVGFQNKSGDVISAGYDNNNVIWVGFSKNLFDVKK